MTVWAVNDYQLPFTHTCTICMVPCVEPADRPICVSLHCSLHPHKSHKNSEIHDYLHSMLINNVIRHFISKCMKHFSLCHFKDH